MSLRPNLQIFFIILMLGFLTGPRVIEGLMQLTPTGGPTSIHSAQAVSIDETTRAALTKVKDAKSE